MYFSNIANSELQHFHMTVGVDFSMSLSDILISDLFKVETIINNSLYRVFPLFYCKKVISSNSKDKLFDTRCLILQKTEHETYLSFITNSDKNNIILNENVLNIKNIGDNLSIDEFNSFVYRLRNKNILNSHLNFEKNTNISNEYGTYKFNNVNGQLRNDTGIIINNKIKNNPLTVQLINPFFLNARYILTFKVRSITGANVCEEASEDYKTTDTFSIELIEGNEINVPLHSYINDSVLDFDVDVSISFDVHEIVNSNFELELTGTDFALIDERFSLTAKLTGQDNVQGYVVNFYENNILIGSSTTNNKGIASLEYSSSVLGNNSYSVHVLGLVSIINTRVGRYNTSITFSSNKSTVYIPGTFIVSGVLSNGIGSLSNATVKIMSNNSILDTVQTNNVGAFNKTITVNNIEYFNLYAEYEGDNKNNDCFSNIIDVNAKKLDTNITINLDNSSIYYTQSVNVQGILTNELGAPVLGATVKLLQNGLQISTMKTNSNGAYLFNKVYNTVGTFSLSVKYDGDNKCNAITSNNKSLTVNKAPVNITVDVSKDTYKWGEIIPISVSSNYGNFDAEQVIVYYSQKEKPFNSSVVLTTKNEQGNFEFIVPSNYEGAYDIRVEYSGNDLYSSAKSEGSLLNNGDWWNEFNVESFLTFDELILLKDDNTFIVVILNNGLFVKNAKVFLTQVIFTGDIPKTFDLRNETTDDNGELKFNFNTIGSGTCKVKIRNIYSNTVSW